MPICCRAPASLKNGFTVGPLKLPLNWPLALNPCLFIPARAAAAVGLGARPTPLAAVPGATCVPTPLPDVPPGAPAPAAPTPTPAPPVASLEPAVPLRSSEFRLSDVPPGAVLLVGIVAVFNVAGELCATQAKCTHRGGPLNEGALDGSTVTCPYHGAQFNVCTGAVMRGPARESLRTYRVSAEGDIGRVDTA